MHLLSANSKTSMVTQSRNDNQQVALAVGKWLRNSMNLLPGSTWSILQLS